MVYILVHDQRLHCVLITKASIASSTNMTMDMDMSSTSTAPMATATSMSHSSSHSSGHSSMSGMSSMSTSMSMANMEMTFFTSFKTPLFSSEWSPETKGHYAGTCIFLIVLSVILRMLISLRPILETRLWTDGARHYIGQENFDIAISHLPKSYSSGWKLSMQELGSQWSRWRVNPAAGRATYELLVAGIAYLL